MNIEVRGRFVLGVVVATVWVLTVSASWAQNQNSAAGVVSGNATRGADLYLKNGCWECHGYTAATGNGAPLVLSGLNETGFVSYLRNPRTTGMPLYSTKVLPDADAKDVYAYIKTFKRPASVEDIPLLQQIADEN